MPQKCHRQCHFLREPPLQFLLDLATGPPNNVLMSTKRIWVDVVAPGFRPTAAQIQAARVAGKSLGLRLRFPKNLLGRDLLCSNSDAARVEHVQRALLQPDSRIIWCLRGGYGSARLLPSLASWARGRKLSPKLLWGISDITALHLFWNQQLKWPSVHGPLLNMLGEADGNTRSMLAETQALLRGEVRDISLAGLKSLQAHSKPALIQGEAQGGTLALVASLVGTPFLKPFHNKVVFFEEIGERAYRIDRMLQQLTQAGVFTGVRAVVFGSMKECLEPDGRVLWPAVVKRWAATQPFPVFTGLPSGHELPCHSIFLGQPVKLHVSARGAAVWVQSVPRTLWS